MAAPAQSSINSLKLFSVGVLRSPVQACSPVSVQAVIAGTQPVHSCGDKRVCFLPLSHLLWPSLAAGEAESLSLLQGTHEVNRDWLWSLALHNIPVLRNNLSKTDQGREIQLSSFYTERVEELLGQLPQNHMGMLWEWKILPKSHVCECRGIQHFQRRRAHKAFIKGTEKTTHV